MSLLKTWKQLTGLSRLIIVVLAVVVVYFTADFLNLVPGSISVKSSLVKKVDLPTIAENSGSQATAGFTPSEAPKTSAPAHVAGPQMRIAGWPWNSQAGFFFAMGGNVPAKGSLMEKYGANVFWYRQDDVPQMQADLITCAQEMQSSGKAECSSGATHVSIMWDGAPAFVTNVNRTLSRLGADYTVENVGSLGYSRGEDKCMGPAEWKADPQKMRGGLIAAVIGDGDWNICLKFMGDNDVPNNPDDTTWDPNAVNWVRTGSFTEADEKYIAGACEDRPVVKNGKRTGDIQHVCVQGVATWTPGDVTVAQKKGGLVSLASTREYSSQMSNAIIGIKKFGSAHPETIENFLRAALEGGDNIKFNPEALHYSAQVSADVYRDQTAAYWEKYYRVVREADATGVQVELGGSYANNLGDNLYLFGLLPGTANTAEVVYTLFGDLLSQQYPNDFPNYVPAKDVINTRYILSLRDKVGTVSAPEVPQFSPSTVISEVVSQRSWQINFVTGSAEFTPDAYAQLEKLYQGLITAQALAVEVHGHTDNVGDDEANMSLSERRAFAVKNWLEEKAPANFKDRIHVRSFGETTPLASNDTDEGRAKNRRVEVVTGSTNR